jgi:hypothetical protein
VARQAVVVVSGALWAMGIAAALSLAWWLSLVLHPLKACPACDGAKRIFSLGRGAWRVCGRCAVRARCAVSAREGASDGAG